MIQPTRSSALPAASNKRRTAAGVKAGRRPPEGHGLDTGEERRTLNQCGNGTPVRPPGEDHRHNAESRMFDKIERLFGCWVVAQCPTF